MLSLDVPPITIPFEPLNKELSTETVARSFVTVRPLIAMLLVVNVDVTLMLVAVMLVPKIFDDVMVFMTVAF